MDAQATITDAIRSVRYNEAVVLTVDDSPSVEIVLVACLDEDNGGIVWRDAAASMTDATDATTSAGPAVDDSDVAPFSPGAVEDDVGIVRHLRTKAWAMPMLNDDRRNRLYDDAIREACSIAIGRRVAESSSRTTAKTREKTRIRILDVGSGTGLLAMMGARHALDASSRGGGGEADNDDIDVEVRVTSAEMASAMARLARITIDENDLSTYVRVVECHSTDADFVLVDDDDDDYSPDDAGLADVCTSELLESGLLGEGVLPSMRDAWERHLRPDAIVVPRRARVFAVPVEGLTSSPRSSSSSSSSMRRMTDEEGLVVVNAVTAFTGPEPRAFRLASRGVRPLTSAAASPSVDDAENDPSLSPYSMGDGSAKQRRDVLDDGSVLLGAVHRRDDPRALLVGRGITVPLHADAMLDGRYRDPSANLTSDDYRVVDDFRGMRPLAEPAMVLDFDFSSGANALPPPTGRSTSTWVNPTVDGACHGVLFWWELDLRDGDDDSCTYSTAPMVYAGKRSNDNGVESLWQDHWLQCLFVFGDGHSENDAVGSRMLTRGAPVRIIASHDDSSISFSIDTDTSAYWEQRYKTNATS
ncbi:hypothetical protein ACHAXA_004977 [Cyclostephanos tholiformis]|uniref:Uncharacterized protein n=1 Tax=Cyclostephanos tholiformis TaxID=382380 RepID=A0ABD3R5T8_9STRA